jgi:PAS domain S-box-containing protein
MVVRKAAEAEQGQRLRALELDLRAREARLRELSSILDVATDGVVLLDDVGRILSLNRSAEALFGYDQNEVAGERFIVLLAPESHGVATEYLDGLRRDGVASLLNDGREVLGRVRQGGLIPLFMTVGRVSEAPERKFCAVLRDITAFKKAEGELIAAKRAAEEASAHKSDFLAKVSHEIRTPLNAIIGFAEVMLEERFGPVGNERYKDYLRDIHASGGHVISLVNDLLDLAKVEAGRMELSFTSVDLNGLAAGGIALMQPQAARERIVMRTSFAQKLPAVVADERSVRQIVLNVIANAIRFTEAGGQVIVSTAATDRGEVALRVRDTGLGMTPEEVEAAMQPFRQLATSRRGGGTGLGLPLTKALVEANRGALRITSARNEGTLVEVLFPPTRVLAD